MERAEAKALGLKRYNTGRACKWGHYSDRLVPDKHCVECVNIRNRKAYAVNIDKERVRSRKYRAANLESGRTRSRDYYRFAGKPSEGAQKYLLRYPPKAGA